MVFNDWLRFQKYAKSNGFDSLEFQCDFPAGTKKCRWLDAYFGMIEVDGIYGFVMVDDLDEIAPGAECRVQP